MLASSAARSALFMLEMLRDLIGNLTSAGVVELARVGGAGTPFQICFSM